MNTYYYKEIIYEHFKYLLNYNSLFTKNGIINLIIRISEIYAIYDKNIIELLIQNNFNYSEYPYKYGYGYINCYDYKYFKIIFMKNFKDFSYSNSFKLILNNYYIFNNYEYNIFIYDNEPGYFEEHNRCKINNYIIKKYNTDKNIKLYSYYNSIHEYKNKKNRKNMEKYDNTYNKYFLQYYKKYYTNLYSNKNYYININFNTELFNKSKPGFLYKLNFYGTFDSIEFTKLHKIYLNNETIIYKYFDKKKQILKYFIINLKIIHYTYLNYKYNNSYIKYNKIYNKLQGNIDLKNSVQIYLNNKIIYLI